MTGVTPFDTVVIWLNFSGAVLAFCANLWAATRSDTRERPVWAAVAVLAAIYAGSYVWLMIDSDVVTWSKVMRGVSLVVWPLVWATAPILSVVLFRRDRAKVRRHADEALS